MLNRKKPEESLNYQEQFYSDSITYIVGVDEAGRGPLAGPVVAGAVIFPRAYINKDINDSKALSLKKREELFKIIKRDAIAYGIGIVSPEKIDEVNIYEATKIAMNEAIKNLNHKYDLILTDAMPLKGLESEVIPIIKGDAKAINIAAASILAKVTRDHIMDELDEKYPEYGFKKHKGYGTKLHLDALKQYGPIEGIHRFSYRPVYEATIETVSLFDDLK